MEKLNIDVEKFSVQGYGIAPLFSRDEIEQLRATVYRQLELDKSAGLVYSLPGLKAQFVKGDLLSKQLLFPVLLDERLLTVARTILGHNDLVYFGDSSYQIGTGSNGFHRDSIDRHNLNGPDWKGKYTLIRLGLYLQDHSQSSGGLKVRVGSHRRRSGKAIFVDSKVGDLVFWDLKTLHSGNAVRLKIAPRLSINIAVVERNIPHALRLEEEKERISLFMTFALKSSHLHRYLTEYTLKRKDTVEHAELSKYSSEALSVAAAKRVTIVNPLNDKRFIAESAEIVH